MVRNKKAKPTSKTLTVLLVLSTFLLISVFLLVFFLLALFTLLFLFRQVCVRVIDDQFPRFKFTSGRRALLSNTTAVVSCVKKEKGSFRGCQLKTIILTYFLVKLCLHFFWQKLNFLLCQVNKHLNWIDWLVQGRGLAFWPAIISTKERIYNALAFLLSKYSLSVCTISLTSIGLKSG